MNQAEISRNSLSCVHAAAAAGVKGGGGAADGRRRCCPVLRIDAAADKNAIGAHILSHCKAMDEKPSRQCSAFELSAGIATRPVRIEPQAKTLARERRATGETVKKSVLYYGK